MKPCWHITTERIYDTIQGKRSKRASKNCSYDNGHVGNLHGTSWMKFFLQPSWGGARWSTSRRFNYFIYFHIPSKVQNLSQSSIFLLHLFFVKISNIVGISYKEKVNRPTVKSSEHLNILASRPICKGDKGLAIWILFKREGDWQIGLLEWLECS